MNVALCGVLLPLLAPATQKIAHADVYHAVSNGDTLSSVAAKYHVSTDQLRAANSLKEPDYAPLGAMLLRVPTSDKTTTSTSNALVSLSGGFGPSSFAPSSASFRTPVFPSGVVGKTMSETVRAGDSWESIAARYRAMGNDVSVDELRRRNGWIELPDAGQNVIVPLGQVAYSAPKSVARATFAASAQTSPTAQRIASTRLARGNARAPRTLDGGVLASGEINLPVVKDNSPQQAPIFGASAISISSPPRRGSALGSRGGYGQLARTAQGGQVRVLGGNEEADAPPASSTARIATNQSANRVNSLARVAKVSSNGARIRRLPQASAVTLYKCAVGTQLAVLRKNGLWSAVLMSDRSTGWLPSKYLSVTSQTVDVSAQIVSNDPGGSISKFGNNYAGENPMVANALTWMGTRYVYGGTTRRGIDCSSLVQHAFASCGTRLPRTAAQQAKVGSAVLPANLKSGDRLYFSASGTRIDHTGLYMGDGLFVHASGSGRAVMVSNLFTPRNWNIFVGARR
ncbi:C40 family peptidase [Abditibacterium utsteinense]|uniref:C40 family peptidase n=1 Tax=Abditibacterium utsteinense TaxID=1960156 RepID=UPI001472E01B|nr:LysM peptidoglycan-binding domain-containing C40 family peptidase [Abditibacterium utsteinense]